MFSSKLSFASVALALLLVVGAGEVTAANRNTVTTLNVSELDAATRAKVSSASTPVIIEFYNPNDPDPKGECAKQVAAFQNVQNHFAGRVTMVRIDANAQNQTMIQRSRIAVCPTHLFVLENKQGALVAKRIWGYLSEDQLKELIQEFYGVKP